MAAGQAADAVVPRDGATDAAATDTLGGLLDARAERFGDRPFLVFEGRTMTVAEVAVRSSHLAGLLRAHGVARGDRVAVALANGAGFPIAWLALARLGAVVVPVNVAYRSADVGHIVSDSGAAIGLAATAEHARRLLAAGVREVGLLAAADAGPASAEEAAAAVDATDPIPRVFDAATTDEPRDPIREPGIGAGDLLNIQYTSGTTGFPKGCMLTHGYWLELARRAADLLAVRPDDVDLTAQPFSYMDPQWNTVLCLLTGIPLVILPRFSASTFWQDVIAHQVTFFYCLGTMPVYLYRRPPDPAVDRGHRVRAVVCSGIVPGLHAAFEERWGVPWREAYGMTETGVDLSVPLADADSVGSGAVGVPVEGKEVCLIDGELAVRGTPLMLGYWNAPEETASRFRDGWFLTGDLATRDERGRFHLVGRVKDMIRRGGENISAVEVESVLVQHPKVSAAAAVAVPHEALGEEVKVFVQVSEPVEPAELVGHLRGLLAPFKVPRYVEFVDTFPMTPSERIAKHLLPTDRSREHEVTG